MSVFQVTRLDNKVRLTINAANVASVAEVDDGSRAQITFVSNEHFTTEESYRSVRGYLKKALAPASSTDDKE